MQAWHQGIHSPPLSDAFLRDNCEINIKGTSRSVLHLIDQPVPPAQKTEDWGPQYSVLTIIIISSARHGSLTSIGGDLV